MLLNHINICCQVDASSGHGNHDDWQRPHMEGVGANLGQDTPLQTQNQHQFLDLNSLTASQQLLQPCQLNIRASSNFLS